MSYENIIVEIGDDFVTEITLNRPNSLNTFTIPLAKELNQALKKLDSENKARVIILKGAGKAFCAGIDISDFSNKSVAAGRSGQSNQRQKLWSCDPGCFRL
jgi:enoyl-CoA hydratase/carnithine racemase